MRHFSAFLADYSVSSVDVCETSHPAPNLPQQQISSAARKFHNVTLDWAMLKVGGLNRKTQTSA